MGPVACGSGNVWDQESLGPGACGSRNVEDQEDTPGHSVCVSLISQCLIRVIGYRFHPAVLPHLHEGTEGKTDDSLPYVYLKSSSKLPFPGVLFSELLPYFSFSPSVNKYVHIRFTFQTWS